MITDIEQVCDRLIVLGKGHTLLDLSISEALAHHRVLEGPPLVPIAPDRLVGSFPSAGGEGLTLIRVPVAQAVADSAVEGRPATLEEVVIGHMAAGRIRRVAAAVEEAA